MLFVVFIFEGGCYVVKGVEVLVNGMVYVLEKVGEGICGLVMVGVNVSGVVLVGVGELVSFVIFVFGMLLVVFGKVLVIIFNVLGWVLFKSEKLF